MSSFNDFHKKFEAVSEELTKLIVAGKDNELFTNLGRARSSATAFSSYIDEAPENSAVDIGNFFKSFESLCKPGASLLGTKIADAMSAYNAMLGKFVVGPGTKAGASGMATLFPTKKLHRTDALMAESYLTEFDSRTEQITPQWNNFLRAWWALKETGQAGGGIESVCNRSVKPASDITVRTTADNYGTPLTPAEQGNVLLLNPTQKNVNGQVTLSSEIKAAARHVWAEYGLDVSPVSSSVDDWSYQFLGSMESTVVGSTFTATWDRKIYALQQNGNAMPVYMDNVGGGAFEVPVMYFPKGVEPQKDAITGAIQETGGWHAWFSFGLDTATGALTTTITLYGGAPGTNGASTDTEIERKKGGKIVPYVYQEGVVGGKELPYESLGGMQGTTLEWSEALPLTLVAYTDAEAAVVFKSPELLIDMFAEDDEGSVQDWYSFYYEITCESQDLALLQAGGSLCLNANVAETKEDAFECPPVDTVSEGCKCGTDTAPNRDTGCMTATCKINCPVVDEDNDAAAPTKEKEEEKQKKQDEDNDAVAPTKEKEGGNEKKPDKDNTAAIGGGVGGAVGALLLLALACFVCKSKKSPSPPAPQAPVQAGFVEQQLSN